MKEWLSKSLFMFAVNQHQRRKDRKTNCAALLNLFCRGYEDYCMEAWIAFQIENRKK